MLETDRLIIRLMEEKDLETARELHNEDSTLNQLTDPFHVSQEEQILWFKKISTSRSSRRYVMEHKSSTEICGVIRLDGIDTLNGSAVIGADVIPSFRNQGYATEAYIKIMDYLFSNMRLHRLQLVTLDSNVTARALYTKLGFKVEGNLREAIFRNNSYRDLVTMGILSQEWFEKNPIR